MVSVQLSARLPILSPRLLRRKPVIRRLLKEIEKAKLDFQRQYNLLLLEQNLLLEKAENIFGERQVAKAANAIEVYRDALSQFKDELSGEAPTMSWMERMTGDFAGTYRKRLENYQKGFGGLNDAQIVTGHKKPVCSVGERVKTFIAAFSMFTRS